MATTNICAKLPILQINRLSCQDISLKSKVWISCLYQRENVRGSAEPVGFILWEPRWSNPSKSCWDILVWTRVVDRESGIAIHWAVLLAAIDRVKQGRGDRKCAVVKYISAHTFVVVGKTLLFVFWPALGFRYTHKQVKLACGCCVLKAHSPRCLLILPPAFNTHLCRKLVQREKRWPTKKEGIIKD